jgi:hypothetical protein
VLVRLELCFQQQGLVF